MEAKNARVLRPDEMLAYPNTTFHITNHAIDDMYAFADRRDKKEFLHRFERHLSRTEFRDKYRRPFPKYFGDVALIAYCILENHFHLVVHQHSRDGARKLMRSVMISFGHYFNTRYGRRGQVFEREFGAVPILDPAHAKNTLAYVHLNHEIEREGYEFCSHDFYVGKRRCDWLSSELGLGVFGSREAYVDYIARNGDRILAEKSDRRAAQKPKQQRPPRRGPATHFARN